MTTADMTSEFDAVLGRFLKANPNIDVEDITDQVTARAMNPESPSVESAVSGGVTALIIDDITRRVIAKGGPSVVDVASFVRDQLVCRALIADFFAGMSDADAEEFVAEVVAALPSTSAEA